MTTNVIMPKLGESVVEGTVTKWLKQQGETIQEMEALLEINTDKVDTEIPSPAAGTLIKILVPEGATVNAGTLLAVIGKPGEALEGPAAAHSAGEALENPPAPAHPAAEPTQAVTPIPSPEMTQPASPPGREPSQGFISPVVAKMARENNLDLGLVTGSGEGGRITKKDVLAYLETRAAAGPAPEKPAWETPWAGDLFPLPESQRNSAETRPLASVPGAPPAAPTSPAASLPGDSLLPLSPARRTIADRMLASQHAAPQVTTVMEADLQRVTAHRSAARPEFERDGAHLTYTAYFVAACVAALRVFPQVNSSWSDGGLVLHRQINIGLAVSLAEEGLIVPVIKGADGLSLLGIARAVNDLSDRARSRRLQPDEVRGSTFTLTNHGTSRSLFATPLINLPNCAILGTGAIQKRPVVINDAIAIRPMLYLGLTFDHRILDGAAADGFLGKVVEILENWL